MEEYLRQQIPLSAGLGVRVLEAGPEGVRIRAPLAPNNLNHRSTAFGGSVAALAILTGWTLVHLRLDHEGVHAHTVIQSADVRYTSPIRRDFEAVCRPVEAPVWERFTQTLFRHHKARVRLEVEIHAEGVVAARCRAAYVAIASGGSGSGSASAGESAVAG